MLMLATRRAAADEAGELRETVRLRYVAPAECPRRAVLEAAVLERSPSARLGGERGAGRLFTVTIVAGAQGYVGSVTVEGGSNGVSQRLASPRCDDVVGALALVIALAIDPMAAGGGADDGAATPATTPTLVPPPTPRGSQIDRAEPRDLGEPEVSRRGGWREGLDLEGLGGGALEGGITAGTTMTAAVELRIGWRGRGHLGLAGLAGWSSAQMEEGQARFGWYTARGSGCWLALARRIEADLCGHVELGVLAVEADGIVRSQETTRLWLAPGAHVGLRWRWGALFAELQAGASVPLTRDHFYFVPDTTIHRTWVAVPWATIGAGLRFGGSK
jgi:hypothetical protein